METIQSDVLIIGCGPTGVVLANLLGGLGCRVAILEREQAVYSIPRATHIDAETLRNFQATGLMAHLLAHTAPFDMIDVVDEEGAVLLEAQVENPESPHGYAGSCFFDQPAFERILREGLTRYPLVTLYSGVEAECLEEHDDGVTVHARQGETPMTFQAAWVVGCDGGRSLTRASLNIEMESIAERRHWLIVDALLKDNADAALLPDHFRYILDPARLTIFAYGIGPNRRWEFQLENEVTPDEHEVHRWLAPYIDPNQLEITRIATYAHNSLLAKRWRVGRVLLAGDAAHMMPPSAGQGMCSGIRDAINLAWKLHRVLTGRAGSELLDSYERERHPHVRAILEGSLFISNRLQADNSLQRWWRRRQLQLIGSIPPLQALLRHLTLRPPPLRQGFLDRESACGGSYFPQVRVRWQGSEPLLDDALGYRFVLIVRAEVLTTAFVDWAEARHVTLWRPGVDFMEVDGGLARWMRDKSLDFALVRPDRHIFGAGKAGDLPRVCAAFDSQGVAR